MKGYSCSDLSELAKGLKPCPFCGGTRLLICMAPRFNQPLTSYVPEGRAYFVSCTSCTAQGPSTKGPGFPDEDPEQKMGPPGACQLWDRRE